MTQITRPNMTSIIAVAKIQDVARKIRAAAPRGERAATNECLISEALHMARQGRSVEAFRHLAQATVPAGSVSPCCYLRSAQYGCSSHGYPRTA